MSDRPTINSNGGGRSDLYARITGQIVEALEKGVRPWCRPWAAGLPINRPLRACGTPYRGINTLVLWAATMVRGYSSPYWLTFRQAKELGGYVRQGEHGAHVVYAGSITRTERDDETGEDIEREFWFLRAYVVFNADQIAQLPECYRNYAPVILSAEQKVERAERFFAACGAEVVHGGSHAYYDPAADQIHMPDFTAFRAPDLYYSTLAHEHVHWTAHPSRLNRPLSHHRGDDSYAGEELIAELGAAYLCADLGLNFEPRPDHAAYIADWLRVLKDDARAIFRAAAQAEKAVGYLHGLQPAVPATEPATAPAG
jgi:antirestriction protein ArdC